MLDDLTGKKILVTGAGGFLGSHLLPQLIQAGASVSAFLRPASQKRDLPPEVNPIYGDCGSPEDFAKAVANQDVVIHLASLLFGSNWQDYLRANTSYAENLAKAVMRGPVGRVLYVSSLAAAGPCAIAPGKKETATPEPVSAYGWSKLFAERILQAALGSKLVILRPPIIYGSGDKGLLPLFKSCRMGIGVSSGNFPVSMIHAKDAAKAIQLALQANASGLYHLGDGQVYNMDQICNAMAKAQGKNKVRVFHPPLPFMGFTAALSQASFNLASRIKKNMRAPGWNWDKYREARQPGWLADNSKITSELGFTPDLDLEAGMTEAVNGYRSRGWL